MAVSFPDMGGDKTIRLMGHTWPAVSATVTLELSPLEEAWEAEVDFVVEEGLPFALLGYEGFFNRWAVSLNAPSGYVLVEHSEDFHARQPPEPFAGLSGDDMYST